MSLEIVTDRMVENADQVLEASAVNFLRGSAIRMQNVQEALIMHEEGDNRQRRIAQGFKEAETLSSLEVSTRDLLGEKVFKNSVDEWRDNFEQSVINLGSRSLEEIGYEMLVELSSIQRVGSSWLKSLEPQLELSSAR